MAEMNKREMLIAILNEVQYIRAKVDKTNNDLLHFLNDMNQFHSDMNQFRHETNNNFNNVERRLQFIETDYNQLNERVDNLERTGT